MKTIVLDAAKIRESSSDEWESIGAMKGESAYEVAVRNGYTGTEAQWVNALEAERSVAISNITSAKSNALNAISAQEISALNSIPNDYTTLSDSVNQYELNTETTSGYFVKNLFPAKLTCNGTNINISGCTGTVNDNTFSFTATGSSELYIGTVLSSGTQYAESCGPKIYATEGDLMHISCTSPLFAKNFITFFDSNNAAIAYKSWYKNDFTFYIPAQTAFFTIRFGIPSVADGKTYSTKFLVSKYKPSVSDMVDGAFIKGTINNSNIVSFEDGADKQVVNNLTATVNITQSGTGTPSKNNIRPIIGSTGIKVFRSGKNMLNILDPNIVTTEEYDVYYAIGGTLLTNVPDGSLFLQSGTYTFSTNMLNVEIRRFDEAGNRVQTVSSSPMTFTLSSASKVLLTIVKGDKNASDYNYQIELGSSATSYESANIEISKTDWSDSLGPIGSGTIDIKNGIFTVDKMIFTVNGTETFSAPYSNSYIFNTGYAIKSSYSVQSECMSSHYTVGNYAGWGSLVDGEFMTAGDSYIGVYATSEDALKSYWAEQYLNNTPVQFVVPLSTPIKYQVEGHDFTTILGKNYIWCNGGNMSVTYRVDTKTYVDNKIAAAIAAL